MKNYIFCFCVLWFIFGYGSSAFAQLDISGRVYDDRSGGVLSNVEISVLNTSIKTDTDNSGFFYLLDNNITLPCTIKFSIDGYHPFQYIVEKNNKGIDFELKKIIAKEEHVEVIQETDNGALVQAGIRIYLDLKGQVYDKNSNSPLPGANVVIKNSTVGAPTDSKGLFYLRSEAEFPCTLRVSMVGYRTQEIQLTRNHKILDFYLSEESILGEEVTVRGYEIEVEQRNFRQIISMEKMDALTLRETASANFYQALSNLKGVDVVMQSMNFMTVNARGFNSTENTRFVQVVDGMDNMAPGMNFPIGNIAGLSELDVESIEFIPGPSEVRYGGNALNGILIMNGKDPFEYQGMSLLVKPGISDIVPGNDYAFQFSGKPQIEVGMRIAKALGERFAFKINASYSKGTDWYANDTTNIRPGNIKWEHDPGHDAINKYGDEVTAELPLERNQGNKIVSRTGYLDQYLVDNKLENLKMSGSLHYKITPDIRAILHGNFGQASTVYTGDNRTSLSDFKIYQGKAELSGAHFLVRGYSSFQDAGNSYDAKFLAVHLNELSKSDEDWFHDYYNAYKGSYRFLGVQSANHLEAREYADRGRLTPGSPEFDKAKNEIISSNDFRNGAGIYNSSALYHADLNFDLKKYIRFADFSFGANYRFYDLNSKGSIFPDTLGNNITLYEYGGFAEVQKSSDDERFNLKTSVRYDKSENFNGHFSPRFSTLFNINETNNVRFSVLTGFRNPGVKEQFINKDLGTARYLGGLSQIRDSYDIPENSIYLSTVNEFSEAVSVDMVSNENQYGYNQAVLKNLDILEGGIVSDDDIDGFEPERVFTFELGYKTKIANTLFLDAVYYNSLYKNFVGISKVVKPKTSLQVDMFTAATQLNNSAQNDVFYLNVNSRSKINVQGVSLGYKWLAPMGAIFSGNMTWTNISTEQYDPVAPGFNTPGFKSNLSVQNRKMDQMENNPGFRNVGFKVTWRYQNRYYWESTFGDGWIEPVSTLDIQFSVNMDSPKSLLKFGASNLLNNKFAYSFGGANVGVMFYVSYVIDDVFSIL
ncbi:TonB-dependent receptor [Draconibacterium mangrovi]|uniref:TonB-dependent receptor n=1 Tax=Draconibacterium mangrovi TaxID=2697469 RepID=UPI0013D0E765|nr:TonB-dependent receptor [Draconibacterium mangrovi]